MPRHAYVFAPYQSANDIKSAHRAQKHHYDKRYKYEQLLKFGHKRKTFAAHHSIGFQRETYSYVGIVRNIYVIRAGVQKIYKQKCHERQ